MRLVYNLNTGDKVYYSSTLSPKDAVIAAHAQSNGDYNTWDYGKYRSVVKQGNHCITCGDWTTLKGILITMG